MLIRGNYLKKENVVYCKETDTLKEVLELLYSSGYRCIPVLDETETKFVGNAYKVTILEIQEEERDKQVRQILRDQEGSIDEESSFLDIFLTIRRLPYLAVRNKQNKFLGILPHSIVFDFLEDAVGNKGGEITLTLATSDYKGVLTKILKAINKYTDVKSIISFDRDSGNIRRIIVSLPKEVDVETFGKLKEHLESKGVRVVHFDSKK